jgi:hypothetical protein
LARRDRIAAIVSLREEHGLTLGHAKAVIFHISRDGNACARCKSQVEKGETVCSSCRGVNLNW